MIRIAVLASGRGSNLQALINKAKLGELSAEIIGVGSDQRDAGALERAEDAGIATAVFPKEDFASRGEQEKALLAWLEGLHIDLLVLAGYMRVLSENFIKEVHAPVLNIHPSLLPAFPGLHAQRQAVEYGVKVAGCTVHFVDEGMDSGPILLQEAVPVLTGDTEESLSARILEAEHRLYPQAVNLFASGRIVRRGRIVEII